MKPHTQLRMIRAGIAAITSLVLLAALSGVVLAAPGGTRPGWGCGDTNHVHTGPPGRGSSEGNPCHNEQNPQNPQPAPAAVRLVISAPGSTTAGSTFNITVSAVDSSGNTQSSFGD